MYTMAWQEQRGQHGVYSMTCGCVYGSNSHAMVGA